MSILKSALVACVMTTLAMLLGYMAPAAIKVAHAQAVPFPPCVNDFRAEIASGQRSPHYPRCLDAHSPSNTRLSGSPTRFDNLPGNCPAGQVYSGGACVTIQNQGGMTAHWAKAFAGETKCTPSPVSYVVRGASSGDGVGYYYNRYWATRCVTIRSDGSFYVTAGSYSNTIRLNEFSSPDQHVNTNIDLPSGSGTILSYVAPIYDRWSGGAISSWAVYGVSQ